VDDTDLGGGGPKISEENQSLCHFFHQNPTQTGLVTNWSFRGARPATNQPLELTRPWNSRRRREDNITMDIKETGNEDVD
jgi:hypothetical protein